MIVATVALLALARQQEPPETQSRRLTLVAQSSTNRLEDIAINADETRILTHDREYAPRLWDRKTMRLLKVLEGHTVESFVAEFSLDGKFILTASPSEVFVWDSVFGKKQGTFAIGKDDIISEAAFSSDGKHIVIGTADGKIVVCDAKLRVEKELSSFKGWVTDIQCALQADVVCAGDDEGRVVALSLTDFKTLASFETKERVLWTRIDRNGKHVVATTVADKAHLFDLGSKKEMRVYDHYMGSKGTLQLTLMASLFVGKDGDQLLVAEKSGLMRLYSVETGAVVGKLEGHTDTVREIRQTVDGTKIATYGDDEQLKIWDTIGQKELPFTRGPGNPTAGEFSIDGSAFWLGFSDGSLRRHDTRTGEYDSEAVGQTIEAHDAKIKGKWLYFQGNDDWIIDALNPTNFHRLGWYIEDFTFSPSGDKASWKTIDEEEYYVCDVASGTPLMRYINCRGAQFTRDSKFLVTWHTDGDVYVWRTTDGELEKGWTITKDVPRQGVSLSPTDDLIATLSEEGNSVQVWNYLNGKLVIDEMAPFEAPQESAFSPDGKTVGVACSLGVAFWDVASGNLVASSPHEFALGIGSAAFSPDGSMFAVWADTELSVFDAKAGKLLMNGEDNDFLGFKWSKSNMLAAEWLNGVRVFDPRHPKDVTRLTLADNVQSFEFNEEGDKLFTVDSCDGLVIWQLPASLGGEAKRLGNYVQMQSEDDLAWLATDNAGRYDASDPANVSGAHYVLEWSGGLETIAVEQLKDEFFEPGLLGKILGLDPEPPRQVPSLGALKLYPELTVEKNDSGSLSIGIEERDDGGVGVLRLWVNGKQVLARNNPPGFFDIEPSEFERFFLPSNLLPQGHGNLVRVSVTNKAGDLESPGFTVDVGVPADLKPPDVKLFALFVGVSDYAGSTKDLTAPASDARALDMALKTVANRLLPGHVETTLLTAEVGHEDTNRAQILKWFDDVATKSTSSDIVVVFLSGHGVNQIAGGQDYFFLTPEADPSSVGPLTATTGAISGKLLGEKLSKIAAAKQVVILDTCHSGAFSSELIHEKSISGDYRRAWQAIRDTTGTWMLAGSAADQQSFEATSVGHGMLTYALLEAMDRASAQGLRQTESGDLFVDVERWLEYAEARVESLKNEVGVAGVQKPQLARSAGSSFDIGVMQQSQRGFIGLKPPRPIVIIGQFDQDREDPLHMEQSVTDALKGDESLAVWTDVLSHPRAFFLTGSYVQSSAGIKATVYVQRFGDGRERKTIEKFDVEGKSVAEVVALLSNKAIDLIKRAKPPESGDIKTGGG